MLPKLMRHIQSKDIRMRTIAIVSAKGGVGKSSMAANISVALLKKQHPTLLIDLDPQNALRQHFGLSNVSYGLAQATLAQQNWRDAVVTTDSSVSLLPYGNINEEERLAFEAYLDHEAEWPKSELRELDLKPESVVIFDTPPGPSIYLQQVLKTVDFAIVVTLADMASLATLPTMERMLDEYSRVRPEFLGAGYIVNQKNSSLPLNRDVHAIVKRTLLPQLIGSVHEDQAVRDALAQHTDTLRFSPYSQAAADIQACASRIEQLLFRDPASS